MDGPAPSVGLTLASGIGDDVNLLLDAFRLYRGRRGGVSSRSSSSSGVVIVGMLSVEVDGGKPGEISSSSSA